MEKSVEELPANWKTELLSAAIRQGPSFVVLLLILFGLWQTGRYVVAEGVPAHLEQIKQGYREIQEAHGKDLNRVIAAFEAEQTRSKSVVDVLDRLVENKALLRQIADDLRAAHAKVEAKRAP